MLRVFKPLNHGKRGIREVSIRALEPGCWVDCREPTSAELKQLAKLTGIPEEDLHAPLDPDERSRIEVNPRHTMIIYRTPFIERVKTEEGETEREISTAPIGFFITSKYIVTVRHHRSIPMRTVREHGLAGSPVLRSPSKLIVAVLTEITRRYASILRCIEKEIDVLEDDIIKEPGRVTIERIMDLKKMLIYFHRSLIANRAVILQVVEKGVRRIDPRMRERFQDLHIETFQLIEVSGTYRDVLAGALDAHTSITSTTLGISMKILTVVMAVLTIPVIITGIYGMNVQLPLAEPHTFWLVILILIFSVWLTWLIFKWRKWI